MKRRRRWTPAKRRRARKKAIVSLRRRGELLEQVRGRQDTAYAGFLPVVQYMGEELELRKRFRRGLHMEKGRNAVFQPQDEAMAVLGRLMLGVTRREHLDKLLPEQLIADTLEIRRWPSGDTERRFYQRFDEEGLAGLDKMMEHHVLTEVVKEGEGPFHVDIDVTGLSSQAEKREGVRSGYMGGPIKPGYQNPRVSVDGVTAWTDLRAGDDGCTDLFDVGLKKARLMRRIRAGRPLFYTADSKFGTRANIEKAQRLARQDKGFGFFVGGSRQYCQRKWWDKTVAIAKGMWQAVSKTTQIKELGEQRPWGPKGPKVRVVAVRKEDWAVKHARKKSRKGQSEAKKRGKVYRHQAIFAGASRKQMTARGVFAEYHEGQRREFDIKDGKQSYEIRKLPVRELQGNRAYIKMASIAQGIVGLYQRQFLDNCRWGRTGKTVREVMFKIGGKNRGTEDDPVAAVL